MVAVPIIIQRIGLKRCLGGWVESHAILPTRSRCESSCETRSDRIFFRVVANVKLKRESAQLSWIVVQVSPSWSPSRDPRSGAERDKKGDLLPAFA